MGVVGGVSGSGINGLMLPRPSESPLLEFLLGGVDGPVVADRQLKCNSLALPSYVDACWRSKTKAETTVMMLRWVNKIIFRQIEENSVEEEL